MGWQPTTDPPPWPTGEARHLALLRRWYVTGGLSLEDFETAVEHVMRGGTAEGWLRFRRLLRAAETALSGRMTDS